VKKILPLSIIILFLFLASACNEQPKVVKNSPVSLEVNKTNFTIMNWKIDNSHVEAVTGKMTVNKIPVAGAKIQISNKRTIETDKNGEFSFTVNRNVLGNNTIHVINVDNAKVMGKSLDKKTKGSLLALKKNLAVYYPIKIDQVTTNSKDRQLMDVYAHTILNEGEEYPSFTPDKYKIGGTIKDANGNPVAGATINLRRDGVEGFSMSKPSDQNGKFEMYYLPEDDEDHYFYVHYKDINYTLPPKKVYQFPADISVNIDVTLPKDGSIIMDTPPTLVTETAPGALYKGTLIGVNVDKSVNYTITIPNKNGEFVLTLPNDEWKKNPSFFETTYNNFLSEGKKSGDLIDSSFIPQPKESDPTTIKAVKK
jgi:hypothetical protein